LTAVIEFAIACGMKFWPSSSHHPAGEGGPVAGWRFRTGRPLNP
jgi:hypothetical protein